MRAVTFVRTWSRHCRNVHPILILRPGAATNPEISTPNRANSDISTDVNINAIFASSGAMVNNITRPKMVPKILKEKNRRIIVCHLIKQEIKGRNGGCHYTVVFCAIVSRQGEIFKS